MQLSIGGGKEEQTLSQMLRRLGRGDSGSGAGTATKVEAASRTPFQTSVVDGAVVRSKAIIYRPEDFDVTVLLCY